MFKSEISPITMKASEANNKKRKKKESRKERRRSPEYKSYYFLPLTFKFKTTIISN